MSDLLTLIFIAAFIVGCMLFMIRGPRADRAGWRDAISGAGRPEGALPATILFLAAVSVLLGAQAGIGFGIVVGACSAFLVWNRAGRLTMSLAGIVAAAVVAVAFVGGVGTSAGPATAAMRLFLLAALAISFAFGAMAGIVFIDRSPRTFALGKGRCLAFFGLVEVFTFLASPGGLSFFGLPMMDRLSLVGAGVVVAFILGMLAGQFTLFLAAVGVLAANVGLAVLGLAAEPTAAPDAATMVSGIVVYLFVQRLGRRTLG